MRSLSSFIVGVALTVSYTLWVLAADPVLAADNEMIKDKSPDGQLALRIGQQDDSGYSKLEIVDLSTNQPVLDLGALGHPNEQDAKLVWSANSQGAFYEPTKRGGVTHVYFRNGNSFEEIQLPTLPEPKTPKKVPADSYDKNNNCFARTNALVEVRSVSQLQRSRRGLFRSRRAQDYSRL